MHFSITMLAYFSPETMLPATSLLATLIGVFMLFGKGTIRIILGAFRALLPGSKSVNAAKGPHFSMKNEIIESPMTLSSNEDRHEGDATSH